MRSTVGIAPLLMLLLAVTASAVTIHVPGDQPTIQAGLEATEANGDTVLLADGFYRGDGNRDLDFAGRALILRSASGDPAACVIDCEGEEAAPHRAFHFHSGEGLASVIDGIGITGGWVETGFLLGGAGLLCENASRPTLRNCRLGENRGSAIYCRDQSGVALFQCSFEGNWSEWGGALQVVEGHTTIQGCEFIGNSSAGHGGAIHGHSVMLDVQDCIFRENVGHCGAAVDLIYSANAVFEDCLFVGNVSPQSFWSAIVNLHGMVTASFTGCTFADNVVDGSGWLVVTSKSSHGAMRGCTIVGNSCPNGTLIRFGESDGRVDNTIIAHNPAGRTLQIAQVLSLTCTDIFGNADGDWVDELAPYLGVDGNICLDPRFCDAASADFTLAADSPCAPFSEPNAACDLIGAWPVGCGPTAAAAISWSAIKGLY